MNDFKFIDLFAGIGGFHIAMEELGGKCVFSSEIDPFARKTYEHNFKKKNPDLFKSGMFNDDIRKINPIDLPDFDILCAGFPCQPFSQAGYKRGFNDTHKSERGNLFFNIVEILEAKNPQAFFLENVRGIVNHDNGNTFKVISDVIENELRYSFHYQVVKASDYGLPQLRPRTFMIGFKNEGVLSNFSFPPKVPLKFNMSDVWEGDCSREIGFTLRVGGRGSNINDRRNWDSYLVNGEVKKIMPKQARKMQGFPESFEFPVPNTQAMKQLGNSVAVDAIKACGKAMIAHLETLTTTRENMANTKNKGEWTELYSFLKVLNDKKLMLADKKLNINNNLDHFNVTKVTTLNIEESCYLLEDDFVLVKNDITGFEKNIRVSDFLNSNVLKELAGLIRSGSKTFNIPEFDIIQDKLGISITKGGSSNQKADIVLGINNNQISKEDEGFGIKSYLGSKPTLLNASGNTNFIFEILNLQPNNIDNVNSINTRTKLKDRIEKIHTLGGSFKFSKIETESMEYNLSMVDSLIPEIISTMLLEFYLNRTNAISSNLENVFNKGNKFNTDLISLQVKVKRLLVSILLGFFAGKKWDGSYVSNGTIVVKDTGEQVGFHIIDKDSLENYLFENIKFDIPSTTRHRYGNLILENDGNIYFKLNMQLRF
ncbi:MAG: HpaII family restriction endonuclease [Thiomargarita sp.]|nr:HpaII family restriction endonuclease [Bacteroidales bacterium]MCK5719029.1 HpaII family restriction endonuclease [Thiomargarita sp.]